ncbi:MAG TPA: Nif3-like dinuclear metal center hexameric protein [Chitinophagaceae bacterium]|nr:Nif3-like dinuclear metal center hexameric protein [Chitinophagaceae bacterium]
MSPYFPTGEKRNAGPGRRAFLQSTLLAAGGAALTALPGLRALAAQPAPSRSYTVQEVIDIILKEIPGTPPATTVDTLKSGSGSQTVTGIVTTMFATWEIIEATARAGANFIIAHEPTFYNHLDDPSWVPGNDLVARKQELLSRHQIAVWRFHDNWHRHQPDGIGYGVLRKTGWLPYYKPGDLVLNLPVTPFRDLVHHLQSTLGTGPVRVIGNLDQPCSRIGLLPGAAGGEMQIGLVLKEHPDVLVVGEVHEWETAEFIRDLRLAGGKTCLVILGHCASEEPGMEWLVDWLQPKVPGLPVTHLPSGSPFQWVS